MSPKESNLPQDWYKKAKKDMKRVRILLEAEDIEGAGFHLRQAAEKAIKGFLLGKGWKLKRSHDLEDLLNSAIEYDSNLEKFREALQFTTEFYIEDRYPYFGSDVPSKDEFEVYKKKVFELLSLLMGINNS